MIVNKTKMIAAQQTFGVLDECEEEEIRVVCDLKLVEQYFHNFNARCAAVRVYLREFQLAWNCKNEL